jgi:hypothetical protein
MKRYITIFVTAAALMITGCATSPTWYNPMTWFGGGSNSNGSSSTLAQAHYTPAPAPTPSQWQVHQQEQHMANVGVNCAQVIQDLNNGATLTDAARDLGITHRDAVMCKHQAKTVLVSPPEQKPAMGKVDCNKVISEVNAGMSNHAIATDLHISVSSVRNCKRHATPVLTMVPTPTPSFTPQTPLPTGTPSPASNVAPPVQGNGPE